MQMNIKKLCDVLFSFFSYLLDNVNGITKKLFIGDITFKQEEYVWSKEKLPIDDRTPYLGKFVFKDIDCKNVNVAAGTFFGLPEQPIESITLQNVNFSYSENPTAGIPAMMDFLDPMKGQGLIFNYVNEVNLENVKFDGVSSEEVSTVNVNKIERN
jgi:polygalacturonase